MNASGLRFLDPAGAVVVGVQVARGAVDEEDEEGEETTEGSEETAETTEAAE